MDALTLDVVDGPCEEYDEDDEEPEPWGWLFPQNKGCVAQDLVKDEYTFGRGDDCDYCFKIANGHYLSLSKLHFKIYREKKKPTDLEHMIIIQDTSSNGTFVNGEKIGKNRKQVLNNDDEIALAFQKNKAFVFYDSGSASSNKQSLPDGFREKYIMSKLLGRGACGEVKLAIEKGTCNRYAVKIISKKTFSVGPVLGGAALDEVKILKAIQHPCIISIQDVFDTPTALYIVLELAEGGELFDRVVKISKFSESTSKLFFYQMLMAVKHLHDREITHRDIKPENILLADDEDETVIKMTDFGLSRFVGENSLMKTLCGTPSYIAPEILESAGTQGYSKAVDLWSLGVILFIMLAGYPPFSNEITAYTLKDQITHARYSFPGQHWEGISEEATDMIKRLLTLDPEARITATEAFEHPWLQDEEVVGGARTLMYEEARKYAMPPPPIPSRKRPASPDESDMCEPSPPPSQPAKRRNLAASPITTPPLTDSGSNPECKQSTLSTKTPVPSED